MEIINNISCDYRVFSRFNKVFISYNGCLYETRDCSLIKM